jgi:hemerythrin-like domain-containing protein
MTLAEPINMETQSIPAQTALREHLLADHRRLEQEVAELLAACEANDQPRMQALWTEFEAGLTAHLEAEESHLVPLLLQSQGRAGRAIIEEHKHIRRRLQELGTALDLHQLRLESFRRFLDELRAHAKTEDRLMYNWADEQLSESAKRSLLTDLAELVRTHLQRRTH